MMRRLAAVGLCAVLTLTGCTRIAAQPQPVAAPESERVARLAAERVQTDAMMAHLNALQDIADTHGGNRAIGTPGYGASVDYVAGALRDSGFEVQIPEFSFRKADSEPGTVAVGADSFTARGLKYTIGTPAAGVTAPLVGARTGDDSPGCTAEDYDGLPVAGAVVLVDRGECPFADKLAAVVARGAVALVVADNTDEEEMGGTLGETTEVKIPVVSVTKADGATLRGRTGPVTVTLEASVRDITVRNVIAQTATGATSDVVMVGAHLDSVPEGPGINDNGSGVAAVLETALQLGPEPQLRNAVRFAFWGAEEVGLVGSRRYLEGLTADELRDIALYLNFDMIASPNPGYFAYDGDQSSPVTREQPPVRVPEGAPAIERSLVAYLESAGRPAQDMTFDGRSDYDAFTLAGIPSGGLFSGAEANMNEEQAELWGGQAHQPFDPNYHKKSDTIEAISPTALGIQGAGVAYIVALYAAGVDGRNGLPVRADRTRHVIKPS